MKSSDFGLISVPVFMENGLSVEDRRILKSKLLLLPGEAAAILRVARRTVYYLLDMGELQKASVKNSTKVVTASVIEYLTNQGVEI